MDSKYPQLEQQQQQQYNQGFEEEGEEEDNPRIFTPRERTSDTPKYNPTAGDPTLYLNMSIGKSKERSQAKSNLPTSLESASTTSLTYGGCHDLDQLNLGSKKFKRKIPIFTPLVSITQITVFIVMLVMGGFEQVWINPMIGPPQETIVQFGGKDSELIRPPHWETWRLVSAFMLHSGIIHLAFNVLWQMVVVLRMELYWGAFRIVPIYIVSGIAGNLYSSIFLPGDVSVGTSSSLSGMLGALLADRLLNWSVLPSPWKSLILLNIQLFLFFLIGLIPFIDNFSHVGGFIAGFFAGLALVPRVTPDLITEMDRKKRGPRAWLRTVFGQDNASIFEDSKVSDFGVPGSAIEAQNAEKKLQRRRRKLFIIYTTVRIVALVVLVMYMAVGFALLYGLVNWNCVPCHYINPTWDLLFEEA